MSVDILTFQFGAAHRLLMKNIEAISHEESLRCPDLGGNCANWIAGHLLSSRDRLAEVLSTIPGPHDTAALKPQPALTPEQSKTYRMGAPALKTAAGAEVAQMPALAEALRVTGEANLERIKSLSPSDLERTIDQSYFPFPMEKPTVGTLLALLAFHESYHTGQLGLVRRVLGKNSGIGV